MGMAGPTAAEWLNGCTLRAKYIDATDRIECDARDWHNLLDAAKRAYGITDEQLADLNTSAAVQRRSPGSDSSSAARQETP